MQTTSLDKQRSITSRRRPRVARRLSECTETLAEECSEAQSWPVSCSDEASSEKLLRRLKAAALAYIRGESDNYIEHGKEETTSSGSSNEEARLSNFWTEAMHGLWSHHLDELYEYVGKQLVDCGGREQLDAIICTMESALAEMH